ncbi:MAG: hypothetical protein ACRCUT_00225, partial [Spirochaetota bacterium]
WNHDIFQKDVITSELDALKLRKMSIGKDVDSSIRLKDFGNSRPVFIEAMSFGGRIRPVVVEKDSSPVEFLGGKNTSFLSDGDSFKAGGYTFIYHEKQ